MQTTMKTTEVITKIKLHANLAEHNRDADRVSFWYHKWMNANYTVMLGNEHGIKVNDFEYCVSRLDLFERLFNQARDKSSPNLAGFFCPKENTPNSNSCNWK